MSVTSKHPLYEKRIEQWGRQRDVLEGEDKIKAEGTKYLPRLDGQSEMEFAHFSSERNKLTTSYEAYKRRATFFNATSRTRDGLVGAIMRKDPVINWPKSKAELLDTIESDGSSIHEILEETLDEVVGVGRFGQLIDAPMDPGDPFIATYFAENITDWQERTVNHKKTLVRVNLRESVESFNADGKREFKPRFRLLHLGIPMPMTKEERELQIEDFLALVGLKTSDFDEGSVYFQEIWDEVESKEGGKKGFVRTQVIAPRKLGGAVWHKIPFVFFNACTNKARPEKPPLLDLAIVNLSHYRNSADLEHGLHFTALPQAWAAGFKFEGEVFIGSGVAWQSEEPNAKAGYLEFSGAGLSALSARMDSKKKDMASLGARLLEETPKKQETATAINLRQAGDRSVLAKLSISVSEGMTKVLRFVAEWLMLTDSKDVSLELNTDFGTESLSPQMITALMGLVQSGLMSWNTFFYNIKRGEFIQDGITEEEEALRIVSGSPAGGGSNTDPRNTGSSHEDEEDDEGSSHEDDDEGSFHEEDDKDK